MIKQPRTWLLLVLLGALSLGPFTLRAQERSVSAPPSAIRYTISLAGFQDHLLHVRMELPRAMPDKSSSGMECAHQVRISLT
jgi:hypothetical protein